MSERRIQCPERLDQDTGQHLLDALNGHGLAKGETLVIDFTATEDIDPRGGAWIVEIAKRTHAKHAEFHCEGQHGHVAEFIELIQPALVPATRTHVHDEGVFEEIGGRVFRYAGELKDFFALVMDAIYWTLLAPLEGRGFRLGLLVDQLYEMGVSAIKIVVLMNFLLGLIIAMLSAAQVAPLGLGIYVADLIMIGFARELAAIMTAVVVSARTGAAITAELATMKVQEEIDALRGMGLNVAQFLVVPRLVALIIVMPCLVAMGMVAGVMGGSVWGILVLEFRPETWFHETMASAQIADIFQGMLKTFFFAITIVLVGCHNGFRVKGGSRGVGLMTTRSVVMDIFFLIVIDMIFAAIFYYVLE